MKFKIYNSLASLLVLVSLFIPLLSNAIAMMPSVNLTVIVNAGVKEGTFNFKVQEYGYMCHYDANGVLTYCMDGWNDVESFSLQTQNLTAEYNNPYFMANQRRVVQETPQGFELESVNCVSPDANNLFAYQSDGVIITPVVWTNIICTFNNKNVNSKTPVLIVPGIMGTEMKNGNELLWPDILRMSYKIGDAFMDPLAFNSNLTPINSSVVIGKVVENPDKLADYTEGLKNEFKNQGYIEGQTLFTFPYDWRYGVSGKYSNGTTNVDLLKNKITSILAQTGASKVDVVAHSMGGLLTKKYIMEYPVLHKIDKAVFVGVPNLGAPEAVKTLVQGSDMDIPFLSEAEVKKISQNMPGAYDLLPSQTYYNTNGSFIKTISNGVIEKSLNYQESKSYMLDAYNLNQTAFTQAETLHTSDFDNFDLKNTNVNVFNIVGCKNSTMTQFAVKETSPFTTSLVTFDFSETGNGDNTVPIESASSINASDNNTYYALKTKHSSLLSQDGSKQEIVNLIAGTNLSVGNNLITKAYLDADPNLCEPSGWFFGILSPVSIEIIDQNGNRAGVAVDGSIQNDILGASYDIMGEHKYVFIPNDENQTYTINLKGTGTGTYTVKANMIVNGQITKAEQFINLPVTSSLIGNVILGSNTTPTTLVIKKSKNAKAETIYPTQDLPMPTNKDQCKNNGWKNYGTKFKNQGDCVSFVNTGK